MPFPEILKSRVRKRAHFQCCLCKALGVEVHHVIPEVDGGPDTEANAAPLCPSCHETYGMNPTKRKFIREARDLWFDICYRRYAPDADRLEEIKQIARGAVSRDDFERFKEELMTRLDIQQLLTPRTEDEILVAIDEFFDKEPRLQCPR